ncbi:MAG: shikimate dehydrogenase [Roseovarius sp.]|nr:shikimate dehydrogenase [Roseovarius sp.]
MRPDAIPLAGVIGSPIGHSRSPQVHGHWLRAHGIRGYYIPMDIAEGDLAEALRMLPRLGFVGVNVTVPHKERALALADHVSDTARLIGAANTLSFDAEGAIHADNTDAHGFLANLRQAVPGWNAAAGPAAVLGAGGAARAVVVALRDAGAPEILIANRTRDRAEALREAFGDRLRVVDWVEAGNMLEQAATVVNTTALGMTGKPPLRVPLDGLQRGAVVADLVYAPLRTRLLEVAGEMGCIPVDGLGMLLHQAAPGFERWFGARPEVDAATRAAALQ